MSLRELPFFKLPRYRELLQILATTGRRSCFFDKLLANPQPTDWVLRHDIDFHLFRMDEVAEIESSLGIRAVYYIPVTLHYNVMSSQNRQILKQIVKLGHKIGLHYDLSVIDPNPQQQQKEIWTQIQILESITGTKVDTVSQHQPHKGYPDPFVEDTRWINPLRQNLRSRYDYVSDSCRVWRNNGLIDIVNSKPERPFVLLLHPELWLGTSEVPRFEFLSKELKDHGTFESRQYFDQEVRGVWLNHPETSKFP